MNGIRRLHYLQPDSGFSMPMCEVIENLLGLVWDSAGEWLPAGIFSVLATGGTDLVSIEKAIVLSVGYAILGPAVMYLVFMRRDVTD